MSRALNNPLRWIVGVGSVALLLLTIAAGSAHAASYGNSTFIGSLEGWEAVKSECKVLGATELQVLCKSEDGYEGAAGNPAGSLSSKAKVLLNLGGQLKSETTWESPTFTVTEGGQGAVDLQRAFDAGGLVELNPTLSYTASLVDKTSGQRQQAISESLAATSSFASKFGGVSLVGGHRYAVVLETEISASLAGVSLGTAAGQFDNVSVTGPGENGGGGSGNGGEGNTGGNGANGLTESRLEDLMKSSLTGSGAIKGNRVFVKAKCPRKVGVACRVTVQGMLKKGKPATAPRTAKIARGKSKQLALKIKPKLKSKLAKRKRLLFKETVKAAKTKATVYKTLKLIRRR